MDPEIPDPNPIHSFPNSANLQGLWVFCDWDFLLRNKAHPLLYFIKKSNKQPASGLKVS
jgi:hypothetical protein